MNLNPEHAIYVTLIILMTVWVMAFGLSIFANPKKNLK